MKQVHAGSNRIGQRQMACSIGPRHARQCHKAVAGRSATELPAKCAGEHFVAGEAGVNRYFQHGLIDGNQPGGGAAESQTLRMLLWSFTGKAAETAVQLKWRGPSACGQGLQRKVVVKAATNVAQQAKKSAAVHRREMIGELRRLKPDIDITMRVGDIMIWRNGGTISPAAAMNVAGLSTPPL